MLPHRFALLGAGAALLAASACNAITGADDVELVAGFGGAAAGTTASGVPTGTATGTATGAGTAQAGGGGGMGATGGTGGTLTGTGTGTGTGTMTGTGTGTGTGGGCTGTMVPDFSLTDVNTTSATYNTDVSPRDYLGQISAWYFGNAL